MSRPKLEIAYMCPADFPCKDCERGHSKLGEVVVCKKPKKEEKIAALLDALKELGVDVYAVLDILWICTKDMWQTARANQMNRDGRDPLFPNDEPCKLAIGNTPIRQDGIDKTIARITEARNIIAKIPLPKPPKER